MTDDTKTTETSEPEIHQDLAPLEESSGSNATGIGVAVILGFVVGAIALVWFQSGNSDIPVQKVERGREKYPRPELSKTGPHPKIEVDEIEHFFGTMQLGDVKEHSYTITNNGEGILVLAHGPKSCACTKYEIEKKKLRPGESGKVLVEWTPKKAENVFRQNMNLYTNDPETQVISLAVVGTVATMAKIMPKGDWDLGNVDDQSGGQYEGLIASGVVKKVELVNVKTSDPAIKYETEDASAKECEAMRALSAKKFKVIVGKSIPAGAFRGTISFELKDRPEKRYTINLKAHRDGSVKFVGTGGLFFNKERQLINLSEFRSKEGRKGLVQLYLSGDIREINALDISTTPSFLKCTLEKDPGFQSPNKSRYSLKLEIPPDSPPGGYLGEKSGRVVIKTDHNEYPEIKLRVRFVIVRDTK